MNWKRGQTQVRLHYEFPTIPGLETSLPGIIPVLVRIWSCVNRSKWQGSCWRSESTSDQRNLYMQPVSVLCISQSEMTDIDVSGVVLSEPSCISTASVCLTQTMESPLTCTYSSYNTSRELEATTVYVLKDAQMLIFLRNTVHSSIQSVNFENTPRQLTAHMMCWWTNSLL